MQLPQALLNSLEPVNGFDKDAFVKVHESGEQVTSIRINPAKLSNVIPITIGSETSAERSHISPLTSHERVPWSEFGYYLQERPSFTFDPLFHGGCYYVQEASGMFLEQVFRQSVDLSRPLKVLDLCAAPGGKSTHILSLISKDSLLVTNEVIRSRANILNDNIIKWGCSNVIVTNNDPKDFQYVKEYFDVIIIDAPCSGSGLFRREPEAIQEWSLQNVVLCSQRQQRILADTLPALKTGGVLIYSTCSYSAAEDEDIVYWLESERKVKSQKLKIKNEWSIVEGINTYRFWPDKIKGEGFFIACFRKEDGDDPDILFPKVKPEKFSNKETGVLKDNVNTEGLSFFRYGKTIHAAPEKLLADMEYLSTKLKVVNCGTRVGEIIRDKLVPDHALAMSIIYNRDTRQIGLNYDDAIRYLKKKELSLSTEETGWGLVTYDQYPLGWINILPKRINNYYPKELRILKD